MLGFAVAAALVAPVGASSAGPIDRCTDAPPWSCADLTARAGGPIGYYPEPWVRGDGVTSIVSYGDGQISGRIRELALQNGQWKSHDLLSQSTGNPPPGIEPSGYVRGDGISTVIYHNGGTETNPQVFELALQNGQWAYSNLLDQPGTRGAVGPSGFANLQGYVRGDGITSVIYVGKDGHIHELALEGGKWSHWDLTVAAGAPTSGSAWPGSMVPFIRKDGTTTIVYRSSDGEIRQLRLGTDSRWHHSVLTNLAVHPKAESEVDAYVRPDGRNAIVYGGTDDHIYELTLSSSGTWEVGDLTAITGAPLSTNSYLDGYKRADGTASVIYTSNGHTIELALTQGTTWVQTDLTARLQAPAGYHPRGIVRPDGVTSIIQTDDDADNVREFSLKTG